jgi:hypothetical protein
MLGLETTLGARVEYMAEVSGRAGAGKQVEFPPAISYHPSKAIWFSSTNGLSHAIPRYGQRLRECRSPMWINRTAVFESVA